MASCSFSFFSFPQLFSQCVCCRETVAPLYQKLPGNGAGIICLQIHEPQTVETESWEQLRSWHHQCFSWLWHMLCNVLSAVTKNQAHNAGAVPAIWKHWQSYHRADVNCTLPVSAASGERGHVVLSTLLKRTSCFLSTNTQSCGSRRNTGSSHGPGTVIKRIISFLSSLKRDH